MVAKLPVEKMRELERRFGEIEARMSAGPAADVYVKLASEYSELQPVVMKIRDYEKALAELKDLESLLEDRTVDREMRDMAEMELPDVKERFRALGVELATTTPEEYDRMIHSQIEVFTKVAKAAGLIAK